MTSFVASRETRRGKKKPIKSIVCCPTTNNKCILGLVLKNLQACEIKTKQFWLSFSSPEQNPSKERRCACGCACVCVGVGVCVCMSVCECVYVCVFVWVRVREHECVYVGEGERR